LALDTLAGHLLGLATDLLTAIASAFHLALALATADP